MGQENPDVKEIYSVDVAPFGMENDDADFSDLDDKFLPGSYSAIENQQSRPDQFYYYSGSMTSPPCKQVEWIVEKYPVFINIQQFLQIKEEILLYRNEKSNTRSMTNSFKSDDMKLYSYQFINGFMSEEEITKKLRKQCANGELIIQSFYKSSEYSQEMKEKVQREMIKDSTSESYEETRRSGQRTIQTIGPDGQIQTKIEDMDSSTHRIEDIRRNTDIRLDQTNKGQLTKNTGS